MQLYLYAIKNNKNNWCIVNNYYQDDEAFLADFPEAISFQKLLWSAIEVD